MFARVGIVIALIFVFLIVMSTLAIGIVAPMGGLIAGYGGSQGGGGQIVDIARAILNGEPVDGWDGGKVPYSWGGGQQLPEPGPSYGIQHGSNVFGVDCAGFTRWVYSLAFGQDVFVPPNTSTTGQVRLTERVNQAEAKPGDLVFFGSSEASVYHVAIYTGEGTVIEAPTPGRYIEENGLVGRDVLGYYHHPLADTLAQNDIDVIPNIPNNAYSVRVGRVLAEINPALAGKQGQIVKVSQQDLLRMAQKIAIEENMYVPIIVRQIFRESGFNPYADYVTKDERRGGGWANPDENGNDPYLGLTQQSVNWGENEANIKVNDRILDVEDAVRAMCVGMRRYLEQQMGQDGVHNNVEIAFRRALAMYNWGPAHFPPLHISDAPYRGDWLTCHWNSSPSCAPEETKKYVGYIMYDDEYKFMPQSVPSNRV